MIPHYLLNLAGLAFRPACGRCSFAVLRLIGIAGVCFLPTTALALKYTPRQQQLTVDPAMPHWRPGAVVVKPDEELNLVGADIMDKITYDWIELFREAYPELSVTIEARGSNTGAPALVSGRAQLAPVGREFLPTDDRLFVDKFGYHALAIRVATGAASVLHKTAALVVMVSKENPIQGLTLPQLDAICSRTRARGHAPVAVWGDLGLTGEWAGRSIPIYGLESNGIEKFFKMVVMQDGEWREGVHYVKNDGFVSFGTVAAKRIANDIGGITYGALSNVTPDVKVVPLAEKEGGPFIMPTVESVYRHAYPLSRYAYIYVNRAPGRPLEPKVKEFLKMVLSMEGQQVIAKEGIYIPLTPEVVREELAKLE
ncbi:MAG: phosphate transporter substrate-binding protein PhoT family [Verrucomicrobia bacterium]|nr:phosphate transporter substrate-binding protein PhoT family [Verrucomicrobiota bacterium]